MAQIQPTDASVNPTPTTSSKAVTDAKAARDAEVKALEEAQAQALADLKAKTELRRAQVKAQVEAKVNARIQTVKDQAAKDIAAAEAAGAAEIAAQDTLIETVPESFHYCLSENHPGAPSLQTSPLSLVRIFKSDKVVPECPACGGQVNSMPCDGADIPPAYILELQERFGR